jgi:hypothetical protein
VHLTEAEWTAVDEAAQAEGLTRSAGWCGWCSGAASAAVVAERAVEEASAARMRATRGQTDTGG